MPPLRSSSLKKERGKEEDAKYIKREVNERSKKFSQCHWCNYFHQKHQICDHLVGAKDAFPKLWMAHIESLELKKLAQYCSGRVSVFTPPLNRILKLTFPTDISGIVTERQIMVNIGTSSLGQSIGVSDPNIFLFSQCLRDS